MSSGSTSHNADRPPRLRIDSSSSNFSLRSGTSTPLRSGMMTPDPLLSALRSASRAGSYGDMLDSPSMTPGSMTPRTRQRFELRRQQLIDEQNMHDQKSEHMSLNRSLRNEMFRDKQRKAEEELERAKEMRKRTEEARRRGEEEDLRRREQELQNVRASRAASRMGSTLVSRAGSDKDLFEYTSSLVQSPHNTEFNSAVVRELGRLPQNRSFMTSSDALGSRRASTVSASGERPIKESEEKVVQLLSFQEERRRKALERQKAKEEQQRAAEARRRQIEAEVEANFRVDEEDHYTSDDGNTARSLESRYESGGAEGKLKSSNSGRVWMGSDLQRTPVEEIMKYEYLPSRRADPTSISATGQLEDDKSKQEPEWKSVDNDRESMVRVESEEKDPRAETTAVLGQGGLREHTESPTSTYASKLTPGAEIASPGYRDDANTLSLADAEVIEPHMHTVNVPPTETLEENQISKNIDGTPSMTAAAVLPDERQQLTGQIDKSGARGADAVDREKERDTNLGGVTSLPSAPDDELVSTFRIPVDTPATSDTKEAAESMTRAEEERANTPPLAPPAQVEQPTMGTTTEVEADSGVKSNEEFGLNKTVERDAQSREQPHEVNETETTPVPLLTSDSHAPTDLEEHAGSVRLSTSSISGGIRTANLLLTESAEVPSESPEQQESTTVKNSIVTSEAASASQAESAGSKEGLSESQSAVVSTGDLSSQEMPPISTVSALHEVTVSSLSDIPGASQPSLKGSLRIKVPNRRAPSIEHLRQRAEPARKENNANAKAEVSPTSITNKQTEPAPALSITTHTSTTALSDSAFRTTDTPTTAMVESPSPDSIQLGISSSLLTPHLPVTPTTTLNLNTPTTATHSAPSRTITPTTSTTLRRTTLTPPQQTPTLHLIKGKRKIYVTTIPISPSSLNHGDVFLLVSPQYGSGDNVNKEAGVVGATIFVWYGKESGRVKRAKAKEVAIRLMDKEWGRKAKVVELEDGADSDSVDSKSFWKVISGETASSPQPDIKTAEQGVDDIEHEKQVEQKMQLYGIKEDNSTMIPISTPGKPLSIKQMQSGNCHVLDCLDTIYVWIGRNAPDQSKQLPQNFALGLSATRPQSISILTEKEGFEHVLFTERFHDWGDDVSNSVLAVRQATNVLAKDKTRYVYDRGGLDVKKTDKIDVGTMFDPPGPPASWDRSEEDGQDWGGPPPPEMDRGCLERKVWLTQPTKDSSFKIELPPNEHGTFYTEESYLILYRHLTGREGNEKDAAIAYFWIGSDCKSTDQAATAYLATDLEKSHNAKQVRVVEGHEPVHFLGIFGRPVIVRRGARNVDKEKEKEKEKEKDKDVGGVLFNVKGWRKEEIRVIEAPYHISSLTTTSTTILLPPPHSKTAVPTYIWQGTGSFTFEHQHALQAAQYLSPNRPIEKIAEGSEPKAFWARFGVEAKKKVVDEYASLEGVGKLRREVEKLGIWKERLWRVSYIVHGNPTAEELTPFTQHSLLPTSTYILDTFHTIYIWIPSQSATSSNNISHRDIRLALTTALEYADYVAKKQPQRGINRDKVKFVRYGSEPWGFRAAFGVWEEWAEESGQQSHGGESPTKTGFLTKLRQKRSLSTSKPHKRPHHEEPAEQVLEKMTKSTYTIEELRNKDSLPLGVDPAHIETYLSPPDFQKHFKVPKEVFSGYPAWKQAELKKKAGLF